MANARIASQVSRCSEFHGNGITVERIRIGDSQSMRAFAAACELAALLWP